MFKKFTNSFNKVVGAGVIAAAGIVGAPKDAETALFEGSNDIVAPGFEAQQKNMKSSESSVNVKFANKLHEKGYSSVELEMKNDEAVIVNFLGKNKEPLKKISIFLDSKSLANKYAVEEEVSKAITEELKSKNYEYTSPAKLNHTYTGPDQKTHPYTNPTSSKPHYTDPISSTLNK